MRGIILEKEKVRIKGYSFLLLGRYLTSSDIKVATYFNINEKTDDYSMFGGTHGDVV